MKDLPPKWAAMSSYIVSALLFWFASFTGGIVIRTTQPNGLAEIQVPYSLVSFIATLASLGVLFFGIALWLAIVHERTVRLRRPFIGSGLTSAGVLSVLFAMFWYLANWLDEGPRCLGRCPLSTLQYYQTVYTTSAVLAVLGAVTAGYGAWLLMGRANTTQTSSGGSG